MINKKQRREQIKPKKSYRAPWQQKVIQILPVIGLAAFILLLIYIRRSGVFSSIADLQHFIKHFGSFAVAAFIVVQAIQPIVPFLPGGFATVVGMLMFGNIPGILYSYIGLVVGEIGLFLLIRRFGPKFAHLVLSEKNFQKFETTLQDHTQDIKRLLIVCFIFPFLPDDLVCLVAGMTDLSFIEYLKILLTFKLWSVASYGYVCLFILNKTVANF
ncbi:VTT domain-containing protein [Enterococcus dongliensis]|uniref:TVP38/TMEM64 family protein n=1 Tax=Enterococcus dongliensis TaxID=2559925 RepID=UPI002891E219|nr:VTT domain-containing protein [Enterococcus dongliensis]MDT2613042.1 VTT domain-containing protein [Enterococcus dongliensis]MDT2640478.1 VTT domain-containing protein [Enterococcus dongliensis]